MTEIGMKVSDILTTKRIARAEECLEQNGHNRKNAIRQLAKEFSPVGQAPITNMIMSVIDAAIDKTYKSPAA